MPKRTKITEHDKTATKRRCTGLHSEASPDSENAQSDSEMATEEQGSQSSLDDIVFVDSGIGGAIAAKLVPGNITELAAEICLPIGDKAPAQIIAYTAQMILHALVIMGKDHVIIACNTASTRKNEALSLVEKVLKAESLTDEEVANSGIQSIYSGNSTHHQRAKTLAQHIERDKDYLQEHVHGVVQPTAERGATIIVTKLMDENAEKVTVRIDSTNGTVKSGAYIEAMKAKISAKMSDKGFTAQKPQLIKNWGGNPEQEVTNGIMTFTRNGNDEVKLVYLQNRGNPAWVPAIEKNETEHFTTLIHESTGQAKRISLAATNPSLVFNQDFYNQFDGVPDLTMLCCTHYPAMREAIIAYYKTVDTDKQSIFLQQDQVVTTMVENITKQEFVSSSNSIANIIIGNIDLPEEKRQQKLAVLGTLYGGQKTPNIQIITQENSNLFLSELATLNFTQALHTKYEGEKPLGHFQLREEDAGINSFWVQDRDNQVPHLRCHAVFRTGISPKEISQKSLQPALALFGAADQRPMTLIRRLFLTISQIAWLGTLGERRGIGALALRHDPGHQMFSAAGRMAQLARHNNHTPDNRQQAAIVTGFTVVDDEGGKICGENDGPPGAVMLARSLLNQSVPVTLITDSGAESSLVAALICSNIGVSYTGQQAPRECTADNLKLPPDLSVKIIKHGPDFKERDDDAKEDEDTGNVHSQIRNIIAELQTQNTKLMISIERPSPNKDGQMSSMSGADISLYNADLSPFFEKELEWDTIGIGDGGNEIGTAGANAAVKSAIRPDGLPLVNNGEKIAATIKTDDMILSSVSNNGGLCLVTAFELFLNTLTASEETSSKHDDIQKRYDLDYYIKAFEENIRTYIGIIENMTKNGMSLDGVNKINDLTVDGRTLKRQFAAPKHQPGDTGATHEDMFAAIGDILKEPAWYEDNITRFIKNHHGDFEPATNPEIAEFLGIQRDMASLDAPASLDALFTED